MSRFSSITIAVLAFGLLVACSRSDPGPLEGTWRLEGFMPMTIEFRTGESEALGMIDKVSYRVDGDSVLVTYETGFSQGTSMRFRVIDQNTLHSELGTLRRIR